LTLGPGAINHGRGEENPKGTEHLESLQWDGAAGAAAMLDRGDIALRCSPGVIAKSNRGFFRQFPSSSLGSYFLHTSYNHTQCMWGNLDNRGKAADRGRGKGGGRIGPSGSKCGSGIMTPRKRCVVLGITLSQL